MEKRETDRRVRKTKKALRHAFAVLLAEKSIKDISVKELTELTDIHRGTFYLHYRDIFDLQQQIENEMLHELCGIIDGYRPNIKRKETPFPLLLALIRYIADNADICQVLLTKNGDMAFVRKLTDIIKERTNHYWIELFPSQKPEIFGYFSAYVIGGCIGVIQHWLDSGMPLPPEHVAKAVETMTLQGVQRLAEAN